uniref:Secreted protein n=1 Tax=Arundo donax TaxID=35708 RepID=A0A0A9F702_ARUDO
MAPMSAAARLALLVLALPLSLLNWSSSVIRADAHESEQSDWQSVTDSAQTELVARRSSALDDGRRAAAACSLRHSASSLATFLMPSSCCLLAVSAARRLSSFSMVLSSSSSVLASSWAFSAEFSFSRAASRKPASPPAATERSDLASSLAVSSTTRSWRSVFPDSHCRACCASASCTVWSCSSLARRSCRTHSLRAPSRWMSLSSSADFVAVAALSCVFSDVISFSAFSHPRTASSATLECCFTRSSFARISRTTDESLSLSTFTFTLFSSSNSFDEISGDWVDFG